MAGIKSQYGLLNDIVAVIAVIEDVHPELKQIKTIATILHLLLGFQLNVPNAAVLTWGQQILLVQLLTTSICSVISAMNAIQDLSAPICSFSIRVLLL